MKPGLLEAEYGDILRQEKEDRETGDYEPFTRTLLLVSIEFMGVLRYDKE